MTGIAWRILTCKPARTVVTIIGLGFLFFLSVAQVGMLVGWCNTTSAIIRHAKADVWVMAERTPAFDYGTAIPRQRVYQSRTVEGVDWAQGLVMVWNTWQRPDGRRVNIELVGLDDDCVGGPWELQAGRVEDVHLPDGVIVDELFVSVLGVERVGDEAEMYGRRAIVRGISRDVRTFTASPFVFTSLDSAIRYDRRYSSAEVTYVLVRCSAGHSPEAVRDRLRETLANVEVLTSHEFAVKTISYWMLETGIGITVVLTALLGFAVINVRVGGMVLVVAGLGLDTLVTVLNWGTPVSGSALVSAGIVAEADLATVTLHGGREVADGAVLGFLGDTIPLPWGHVLSIGDLLVLVGICLVTASVLRRFQVGGGHQSFGGNGRFNGRGGPTDYRSALDALGRGPAPRRGPGLHPSRLPKQGQASRRRGSGPAGQRPGRDPR